MRQGDVVIGELSPSHVAVAFVPTVAIVGWVVWRLYLTLAYDAHLSPNVVSLGVAGGASLFFIGPMMWRSVLGLPGFYIRDGHVTYLLPSHKYLRIDAIQAAFLSRPPRGWFRSWLTLKMTSGRRESIAIFLFRTPAKQMLERLAAAGVPVLDHDPDERPKAGARSTADV